MPEEDGSAVRLKTALVRRRCQGCGCSVTVRLEATSHADHRVWCDACLKARIGEVQAAREQPRRCPHGHLLAGENLLVTTHPRTGARRERCRTCRQGERRKEQG